MVYTSYITMHNDQYITPEIIRSMENVKLILPGGYFVGVGLALKDKFRHFRYLPAIYTLIN